MGAALAKVHRLGGQVMPLAEYRKRQEQDLKDILTATRSWKNGNG